VEARVGRKKKVKRFELVVKEATEEGGGEWTLTLFSNVDIQNIPIKVRLMDIRLIINASLQTPLNLPAPHCSPGYYIKGELEELQI